MTTKDLESRIAALEKDVELLKKTVELKQRPWWEKIAGTFADDPIYDEAMSLGRKYRESLRPNK